MPVLLDITVCTVILAYHPRHITHTGHLAADGVAEDDLIGYLLYGVPRRLYMDGHLLVVVADAATHGGEPLSLQTAEEHLLSDAIGLKALAVYVERDLLFLFAVGAHVSHRGNTAQTVAELVGIRLQLTVAALRTLYGNQQGRGVAEVIVGYQGNNATGQRRLKQVQSVLDLTPHLVLVVYFVVQAYHHDTHAVLRGRGGLGTVHLTVCEEVSLQGFCHLLLDFL